MTNIYTMLLRNFSISLAKIHFLPDFLSFPLFISKVRAEFMEGGEVSEKGYSDGRLDLGP